MNPLAAPLYELLNAVWNDPQYKEIRDRAFEAHARHASEGLAALKSGEKLAPLLMQMSIAGFTEDDYEAMETYCKSKLVNKRARQEAEMHKAQAELLQQAYASKLAGYQAQLGAINAAMAAPVKKPWWNKF